MRKTYKVDLSTAGITELQTNLRDYKTWLKKKCQELCRRLAETGAAVSAVYFETAPYDGINDVFVRAYQKDGGWVVSANGNAVLFIEFGTGVHYPDEAPLGEYEGAAGMIHGSYGKGLGNNDYWFYTGQPGTAGGELATDPVTGYVHPNTTITHGNPASMPMYNTVKELEMDFVQMVKEVFSS